LASRAPLLTYAAHQGPSARRRLRLNRTKYEEYWVGRLNQRGRSSSLLWHSLSPLLSCDRDVAGSTDHTADSFAEFFDKKVRDVQAATAGPPPPPILRTASSSPASFRPCTPTEVSRIIMQSPVKSCMLDPVTTFLMRESVDLLLPFLTTLINTSLMQGRLPSSQKHAIVTPHLKRSGLDPTDIANFRPVSNLTFMSKVTERVAASQITTYLSANGLMPRIQSAYRKKHSTETAMLRVWSDVLTPADVREVTQLGLLDLSAAFDCVDHNILLHGLEVAFGLTHTEFEWIRSFLTDRMQ